MTRHASSACDQVIVRASSRLQSRAEVGATCRTGGRRAGAARFQAGIPSPAPLKRERVDEGPAAGDGGATGRGRRPEVAVRGGSTLDELRPVNSRDLPVTGEAELDTNRIEAGRQIRPVDGEEPTAVRAVERPTVRYAQKAPESAVTFTVQSAAFGLVERLRCSVAGALRARCGETRTLECAGCAGWPSTAPDAVRAERQGHANRETAHEPPTGSSRRVDCRADGIADAGFVVLQVASPCRKQRAATRTAGRVSRPGGKDDDLGATNGGGGMRTARACPEIKITARMKSIMRPGTVRSRAGGANEALSRPAELFCARRARHRRVGRGR